MRMTEQAAAARLAAALKDTDEGGGARAADLLAAAAGSLTRRMHALAEAYRRDRCVVVDGFIPPGAARAILDALPFASTKRQDIQAAAGGNWSVFMLDESLGPFAADAGDDAFSILMLSTRVVAAICDVVGKAPGQLLATKRWINRYQPGEYITPHKDTTGDFQAVVCLEAPPPGHGGELGFETGAPCALRTGDLLLFAASAIRHWTAPLVASPAVPEPVRYTGICRFYVVGGNNPGIEERHA